MTTKGNEAKTSGSKQIENKSEITIVVPPEHLKMFVTAYAKKTIGATVDGVVSSRVSGGSLVVVVTPKIKEFEL